MINVIILNIVRVIFILFFCGTTLLFLCVTVLSDIVQCRAYIDTKPPSV